MLTTTSTIDAAGRIVIPQAMRKALDLTEHGKVEIVLSDGQILIRPARCEYKIVKRGFFAVAESAAQLVASDHLSTADIEAVRDSLRKKHAVGATTRRRKP